MDKEPGKQAKDLSRESGDRVLVEMSGFRNLISDGVMADMSERCRKLDRMLGGLIKSRVTIQ